MSEKLILLSQIEEAWIDCTDCKLHISREQVVFWRGSPDAPLGIIGEAPGADEDCEGFPFVGRSGELIDRTLDALELYEEDVWIANVIGCRPPGNRNPEPDELLACRPRLASMMVTVHPRAALILGRVVAQRLIGPESISALRGSVREVEFTLERKNLRIPAVVSYHPSHVLRNLKECENGFKDDVRTAATLAGLLEAA